MMTELGFTRRPSAFLGAAVLVGALVAACATSGKNENDSIIDGSHVPFDSGHSRVDASDGAITKLGPPDATKLQNPDSGNGMGVPHGCDVSCPAAGGTCANNSCTLKENPGALSPMQEQQLNAGGNADPSFAWLYPYNNTIFPRGLIPPTLQFAGTAPDALLVHITYSSMNYVGYYAAGTGANPAQAKLSELSWTAVTQGADASDVVTVAVTKLSNGQASGPITRTWSIAQGNMRGQIYYETYGSSIIGGAGVGIMSIAPGATTPTPIAKGCGNVCHTASADGSTLVANAGNLATYVSASASYNLKTNPPSVIEMLGKPSFTYGGLYPDGTFAMSATNYRTWLPGAARQSHLYNTATGAQMTANGWDGVYTLGGTTAFSPDGTLFAFNRNELDEGEGHYLALANFDVTTTTFSNGATIATDMVNTLAWPSFTPDDGSIVYHAAVGGQMGSGYETDGGSTGNVYRIDLPTKTPVKLNALDGYDADGMTTYLPDSDPDLSFTPTVLPEALGGYFWVVFTSHRSYGNTLPSMDNMDTNGKLWVAAIDLNVTPGMDSSHPAFYLDGQESSADCLRGFWVLPPCQQNGTTCSSGDECCTGFCRPDGEGGAYSCVPAPSAGCSNEYEKCTMTSDCCQASSGYTCIGGYCAAPAPK